MRLPKTCTAFEGERRLATGNPKEVALAAKAALERGLKGELLIFDDQSGRLVDFDLSGEKEDVLDRLAALMRESAGDAEKKSGPGRPKLGVVSREVTLLPRHWEWLDRQTDSASAVLRRLVEAASRGEIPSERMREAKDAAYRFMSAIAGNYAGFEEAARALYAGNKERFDAIIAGWPDDVREHAQKLARPAFSAAR